MLKKFFTKRDGVMLNLLYDTIKVHYINVTERGLERDCGKF